MKWFSSFFSLFDRLSYDTLSLLYDNIFFGNEMAIDVPS